MTASRQMHAEERIELKQSSVVFISRSYNIRLSTYVQNPQITTVCQYPIKNLGYCYILIGTISVKYCLITSIDSVKVTVKFTFLVFSITIFK